MSSFIQVQKLHIPSVENSDLSFSVEKGEIVGLTGPTGCGKSALLRLLAGLERPKEMGRVLVDGLDPYSHLDERRLRLTAGLIPQRPAEAFFLNRLGRDLLLGPENAGWEPDKAKLAVQKELESLSLKGLRKKKLSSLSMEDSVKAALAGILVLSPQVLLLDGILSVVEKEDALGILHSLLQEAREKSQTVLFVSARLGELKLADRVLELQDGLISDCTERIMHASDVGIDIEPDPEEEFPVASDFGKQDLILSCVSRIKREEEPLLILPHQELQLLKGGLYRVSGGSSSEKAGLLRILAGRSPVKKGSILAEDGMSVPGEELVRISGYASSDPARDFLRDTVLEDAAVSITGDYTKQERREKARSLLLELGFPENKRNVNPRKLSYGEMRLVSLAGALAGDKEIDILDCPFSGLDAAHKKLVKAALKKRRREGAVVVLRDPDHERAGGGRPGVV